MAGPVSADHAKTPPYKESNPVIARTFDRRCPPKSISDGERYLEVEGYDLYYPIVGRPDTFLYYLNHIQYGTIAGRRYEFHAKEIHPFLIYVPSLNRTWEDPRRKGVMLSSTTRIDDKSVLTNPCDLLRHLEFGYAPYYERRVQVR